jgi:hypothetical protein
MKLPLVLFALVLFCSNYLLIHRSLCESVPVDFQKTYNVSLYLSSPRYVFGESVNIMCTSCGVKGYTGKLTLTDTNLQLIVDEAGSSTGCPVPALTFRVEGYDYSSSSKQISGNVTLSYGALSMSVGTRCLAYDTSKNILVFDLEDNACPTLETKAGCVTDETATEDQAKSSIVRVTPTGLEDGELPEESEERPDDSNDSSSNSILMLASAALILITLIFNIQMS